MCPEFLTYLQSTWYSWVRTKHVKVSSSESSFRVTTIWCLYNLMATLEIYSEYVEVFCASTLALYVLQRQTDWCVVEQVSHLQPGASKQEALSLLRGTANVWKSVEVCGRVGTSGEGERERPLPEPRAVVGLAWAEGFPLWLGLVSAKVEWRVKLSSSIPELRCILQSSHTGSDLHTCAPLSKSWCEYFWANYAELIFCGGERGSR